MAQNGGDKEEPLAALLITSELTIGALLHALHLPFRGHLLAANQAFLLNRASLQLTGSIWTPISLSLKAASAKLLAPSVKRLTPAIALTLQGTLFSVGLFAFGRGKVGRLVGGYLLLMWPTFQRVSQLYLSAWLLGESDSFLSLLEQGTVYYALFLVPGVFLLTWLSSRFEPDAYLSRWTNGVNGFTTRQGKSIFRRLLPDFLAAFTHFLVSLWNGVEWQRALAYSAALFLLLLIWNKLWGKLSSLLLARYRFRLQAGSKGEAPRAF